MSSHVVFSCDGCKVASTTTPEELGWLQGRHLKVSCEFSLRHWQNGYAPLSYCSKQCALEAKSIALGFASRST